MMKQKVLITSIYWILAILLISGVLSSLDYSFSEAILLGCLFPPGALALKFFYSKIRMEEPSSTQTRSKILVGLAIMAFEYVLILLALTLIFSTREAELSYGDIPSMMLNPLFILLFLGILLAGDYFLDIHLKSKVPAEEEPLSFVSDRKKETVLPSNILYVESNDTEVWIYMKDGKRFRNKTAISRWQDILGENFVRVHRSYLVRRDSITDVSASELHLGEIVIPVSKKYSAVVLDLKGLEKEEKRN